MLSLRLMPAILCLDCNCAVMRGLHALVLESSTTHENQTRPSTSSVGAAENFSVDREIAKLDQQLFNQAAVKLDSGWPTWSIWNKFIAPRRRWHYLRIPKTGSTSIIQALQDKPTCTKNIALHFHTTLREDISDDPACFTVMREPVDRFISQWSHVRRRIFDVCNVYLRGKPELKERLEQILVEPITWAHALHTDDKLGDMFLSKGSGFWKSCLSSTIMWRQSAWVSRATRVACLPNLLQDTRNFLADVAPDCHFKLGHYNDDPHPSNVSQSARLVSLVHKIYPEDFDLWRYHCEKRTLL